MNGLRTNLGVPISIIEKNMPANYQKWNGYLERKNRSLFLKLKFFHLADEIAADLMVGNH